MIEINLLPEELRKKKGLKELEIERLAAMPVVLIVIASLIVAQLLLALMIQVKKASLNSLNKKLSSISTLSSETRKSEDELKEALIKIGIVEELTRLRFKWAKKLNDLSDSVVSGIWLRSVNIKKAGLTAQPEGERRAFVIEGSSLILGEGESRAVGNFVNALKENASFSQNFDEIELTKVERRKIKETELMDFIITPYFKEKR